MYMYVYIYTILKVDGSALFQGARIDGAVLPQFDTPQGRDGSSPLLFGVAPSIL